MTPNFVSTVEYVTFHGKTISAALGKLSQYLIENNLDEEENIDNITIDFDETENIWLASCHAGVKVGKSFKELGII